MNTWVACYICPNILILQQIGEKKKNPICQNAVSLAAYMEEGKWRETETDDDKSSVF